MHSYSNSREPLTAALIQTEAVDPLPDPPDEEEEAKGWTQ